MANFKGNELYIHGSGLKTGMYYLRTKAATDAIKFTVTKEAKKKPEKAQVAKTVGAASTIQDTRAKTAAELEAEKLQNQSAMQCSLDDPEGCEMCGS